MLSCAGQGAFGRFEVWRNWWPPRTSLPGREGAMEEESGERSVASDGLLHSPRSQLGCSLPALLAGSLVEPCPELNSFKAAEVCCKGVAGSFCLGKGAGPKAVEEQAIQRVHRIGQQPSQTHWELLLELSPLSAKQGRVHPPAIFSVKSAGHFRKRAGSRSSQETRSPHLQVRRGGVVCAIINRSGQIR